MGMIMTGSMALASALASVAGMAVGGMAAAGGAGRLRIVRLTGIGMGDVSVRAGAVGSMAGRLRSMEIPICICAITTMYTEAARVSRKEDREPARMDSRGIPVIVQWAVIVPWAGLVPWAVIMYIRTGWGISTNGDLRANGSNA